MKWPLISIISFIIVGISIMFGLKLKESFNRKWKPGINEIIITSLSILWYALLLNSFVFLIVYMSIYAK